MNNFKLDKYHRDLMMKCLLEAITEVESEIFNSIKSLAHKDRSTYLHQLDVLSGLADRVTAKLS